MSGEDLLLLALAVLAAVLLVAGLIQAFQTPSRRRPRRGRVRGRGRGQVRRGVAPALPAARRVVPEPTRAPDTAPAPPPAPIPAEVEEEDRGEPRWPRRKPSVSHAEELPSPDETVPGPEETNPAVAMAPVEEALALQPEPPAPPSAALDLSPPSPVSEPALLPLEKCLALYQSGQDRELISVAEPQLESDSAGSGEPTPGLAALWSLVGLSKQALHDEEGARAAFEAASHGAPEADKPIYERYLTTLIGTTKDSIQDEERDTLRRGVLWVVYGHIVNVLVQRQNFQSARRLIWEALADEELPADRREVLMELLYTTYTGEIDQLTTYALRTLQGDQERETLTSLRRAEGLLSTIPEEALTPERREEVARHLWWGYAKVGLGRAEAGEFEYALEPLFHALRIGSKDRERQQEVRVALVRTLDAVADGQAALIAQFVKDGQREVALTEGERLLALIEEGMDAGLSEADVAPALTKARRVVEQARQG